MDVSNDIVKMPHDAGATPIALDGGWGWVVVGGSFLAYFIADGWAYSFGIIYPNLLEHFQEGKGKTAIIGALLYGVPLLVSPLVCALTTVYGCRKVTMVGGALTGLSFILSAFATSVDFLCFSTGILASLGLSMTYVPAIVIVTCYFKRHRGLATGLAVTGSGLGAFTFPPLLSWMLEYYDWNGALLLLGGICFNIIIAGLLFRPPPMTANDEVDAHPVQMVTPDQQRHLKMSGSILMTRLHHKSKHSSQSLSTGALDRKGMMSTLSIPNICFSSRTDPEQGLLLDPGGTSPMSQPHTASSPELFHLPPPPPLSSETQPPKSTDTSTVQHILAESRLVITNMLDRSLLSNWPFLMYCGQGFILFLWVGVPYVYLVDKSMIIGISASKAAFLLSIIGISRTLGQVILGFLGDGQWVSTTVLYAVPIGLSGLATALVPIYKSYATLCLYSMLFGFFVSVTYSLQMMCIVEMVGIQRSTNAFGLMQLAQGIATLLGTPITGWLFDATGKYDPSFYTAGGFIILSALMLAPVPLMLQVSSQPHHSASPRSGTSSQ